MIPWGQNQQTSFKNFLLFICFCLRWVLVSLLRLPLVGGFSLWWLLLLWSIGSGHSGSVVVALGLAALQHARDWPRLAQECPGDSGGGVGWWWPAAELGTLSTAVHAWNLLKEIAIIIISTIVWPQVNNREGKSPSHQQKIGLKIYWARAHPSEQDPVSPSVSLPSGSFHKLLILLHQRADRMKTIITEN